MVEDASEDAGLAASSEGKVLVEAPTSTLSGLLAEHGGGLLERRGVISVCAGSSAGTSRLLLHPQAAFSLSAAASDPPPPRRQVARALHALLCALFPLEAGDLAVEGKEDDSDGDDDDDDELDAQIIYEKLAAQVDSRASRPSVALPELPALLPTLRRYQQDAVGWMLAREGVGGAANPAQRAPGAEQLWRCLPCADGSCLHWNACNGAVAAAAPSAVGPDSLRGGILADEMGLGKSVEVLALLLAHRAPAEHGGDGDGGGGGEGGDGGGGGGGFGGGGGGEGEAMDVAESELPCVCEGTPPDFNGDWVGCDECGRWCHACCAGFADQAAIEASGGSYRCLLCACRSGAERPTPCRTTLLVCPAAILGQWKREAERHVSAGALRVAVYGGVREALHTGGGRHPDRLAALHPERLAGIDLLLTSFETLRTELDHAPEPEVAAGGGRTLRGGGSAASAARHVLSPLLSQVWWRLVLDEAQMVESGTAKAAAMTQRLHATQRWAVSGTPMGRGRLGDLRGLMSFLRLEPWCDRAWWQHAVEAPLTLGREPAPLAPPAPCPPAHAAPPDQTPRQRCPKGHALTHVDASRMQWYCDRCDPGGEPRLGGAETWRCKRCDYDVCAECIGSIEFTAPPPPRARKPAPAPPAPPPPPPDRSPAVRAAAAAAEHQLLDVLHAVMWRNSKATVVDQLALPPQTVVTHSLAFSSIEQHFYMKQHRECEKSAARALQLFRGRDSHGDKSAAAAARALELLSLQGVLRLRQACCHPQLGSFGIHKRGGGRGGAGSGAGGAPSSLANPMTMEQILGKLVEEEKGRCEEEQRKVLLNLSALASMCSMHEAYGSAVERYDAAISTFRANRRPVQLEPSITASLLGPTDLSFAGPEGAWPAQLAFGAMRWSVGRGSTPTPSTEPSLRVDGGGADAWVRIELSKPRRLCELRLRLLGSEACTPRRCVLDATSGSESSGVFIEVSSFECQPPPRRGSNGDGGGQLSPAASRLEERFARGEEDEWQCFGFYRPFKSKQYRLRVLSWHAPAHGPSCGAPTPPQSEQQPAPAARQPALEISGLELREADLEVDPLQLLHVTSNRTLCSGLASQAPPEDSADGPRPDGAAPAMPLDSSLDPAHLRSQLVGERAAVQSAQHVQLRSANELAERTRGRLGSVGAAHWLMQLVDELSRAPAAHRAAEALRERVLSDPSLASSQAAAACARSPAAAVLWAATELSRCLEVRAELLRGLLSLSSSPGEAEVLESGNCSRCRADWGKRGRECALPAPSLNLP